MTCVYCRQHVPRRPPTTCYRCRRLLSFEITRHTTLAELRELPQRGLVPYLVWVWSGGPALPRIAVDTEPAAVAE